VQATSTTCSPKTIVVGEVECVRHHEEPEQKERYAHDDTHGVILHLLKHIAGSWSSRDPKS